MSGGRDVAEPSQSRRAQTMCDTHRSRLVDAGSEVTLLGDWASGDPGTIGVDTPELLAHVPVGFDGYIWTNKIELIGPLVRR